MKIRIPHEIALKIKEELKKACDKEVGGILMGEHVEKDEFKIYDVTIQKTGGFAFFERVLSDILEPLKKFFIKTNQNYRKYNYLGEWHSHPSFMPLPSQQDHLTMVDMINDDSVGANFVVLIILKLVGNELKGSATIYQRGYGPKLGQLIVEPF